MSNVSRFTAGIEDLSRRNPEIFGAQTTEPLVNQASMDMGMNWVNNQRLGGGDDIENLEAFASQPERFGRPQERILESLSRREGAGKNAAKARERRARKADVDAGTFERSTRGRGLSARQQKAATRRLGLSRSLAIADAGSSSRRSTTDLAIGARKSAAGLEKAIFGQELAGMTSLGNAEGQKQVREAQEAANSKSARRSTTGMVVGAGLSLLSLLSSEQAKDKRGKAGGLLDKLKDVRIERWNYKGEDKEHIGPYAEEFNNTFGTTDGDLGRINLIDYLGVTLGAVKELNEKVEANG
jgi:hypothetical protein